jgi:N-acetylmuramoyl-L-alanine amidase
MIRLLLLSLALSVSASGEELPVVVNGRAVDPVDAYKIGSSYYLDAKRAGELYGAQVYWYHVSGRLQLSLRGRQAQFVAESDEALLDGKSEKLSAAVLLRANQAFIPLDFLISEAFESWAGMDGEFNERSKLLTLDKRSNVGAVRWFSYKGRTRLAFEMEKGLKPQIAQKGLAGLEVSMPLGVIERSEAADINDGIVAGYTLRQDMKVARLQIRLARPSFDYKTQELENPRRFVIDLYEAPIMAQGPVTKSSVERSAEPSTDKVPEQIGEPTPDLENLPSYVKVVAGATTPAPKAPQSVSKESVRVPDLPSAVPIVSAKRKILVDAGHGGKDSGAIGRRGTEEKDINLLAAKELAALLKEEGVFDVRLTRSDDTFVELSERSNMANEARADLFISLHCNGHNNPRESGFEVYFLSEKASDPGAASVAARENASLELEGKSVEEETAQMILHAMQTTENINESSELAALITRALSKRVDLENRGVKQAGFYVLRGTYAPAVLVEMAFVTSKNDEVKLESKKYRRKIVDGVYAGVLDYAKRQGWMKEVAKGK